MTTTIARPDRQGNERRGPLDDDAPSATSPPAPSGWLAALRLGMGFLFLWAFADKLFGLGYSTPSERAWLNGGSPTKGFLGSLDAGPLAGVFRAIAGDWWVDWLFMLGLVGIGAALVLGVAMRLAAGSGALLMALMWLAEWHPARFTSAGEPTGSTNPLVDYHLIYGVVLIVLAVTAAGDRWGLGRAWKRLRFVRRHLGVVS
jgi:thiosulfate dehydrogenase (quinone) large subunit